MNCRQVDSKLSAYLDGELVGSEMMEIRRHLSECRACAEEAAMIARIKDMVAMPREFEPSQGFEDRLVASVFDRPRAVRRWMPALGLACVAAAATLLAFLLASGSGSPSLPLEPSAGYSTDLIRDQSYFNATDPLSGPAPMMGASYVQK